MAVDPSIIQGGIGAAALGVLIYVVRELRGLVKDNNAFFGENLSQMTEVLRNLTVVTQTQATLTSAKLDRLHDDNIEQAGRLREADAHRVRKVEEQGEDT